MAVLTAIAIPVFSAQLEKSREATDMANVRSAYATLVAKYLEDNAAGSINVPAKQSQDGWQTSGGGNLETMVNGSISHVSYAAKTAGDYVVAIDASGNVTVGGGAASGSAASGG